MDVLEKSILRSINCILETDPAMRRKQLHVTQRRMVQTKWDMYCTLKDQCRFMLEDIRSENNRERRRQMMNPVSYINGPAGRKPPSLAEIELENIIRSVSKMDRNRDTYKTTVETLSAQGSAYGYFKKCAEEIRKSKLKKKAIAR